MNALTRSLLLLPAFALSTLSASAASFYAQPTPSNEEQYILELINAARANPAGEGQQLANITDSEISRYYTYYGVVRSTLVSDFDTYAVKPPLAFNSDLNASALSHSQDQAVNGFQGHNSSDGTSFSQRISDYGYQWGALGENVYTYVENPYFGHVGLNADWGVPSLDHRANIMNTDAAIPTFKQIGISYVPTSVKDFGPYVLTEDFGTPLDDTTSFLTGVVYNDANHNNAYDMGEGLQGVTITTSNGAYYTMTTGSGGYVLPLPSGSGTLTITASGGSLGAPRVKTITYGNATNVKVDFTTAQAAAPVLPVVQIKASETQLVAGGKPSVITIARTGSTTGVLHVVLATSGNAIPGVDCTALPKTVTIAAGALEAKIKVKATAAANTGAPSKKINIKLQSGAGYLVSSDAHLAKAAVQIWAKD